jgi:carboxymethylenebutenolidase
MLMPSLLMLAGEKTPSRAAVDAMSKRVADALAEAEKVGYRIDALVNPDAGAMGMGERVRLTAADGRELGAYVARPEGEPIGALVVLQEIFGVNAHIRSVADGFARDGFLVVAPVLFDRIERDVELGYEGADREKALSFIPKLDFDASLKDVAAAMKFAAKESGKKVGVVGYCFGGSLAWLAVTRLDPAAAVGYYGGQVARFVSETPKAPVMLHFGREDKSIPMEAVEKVEAAHPEVEVFTYDAGHAFNRDGGASYQPDAAKLARERTVEFLKKNLAG